MLKEDDNAHPAFPHKWPNQQRTKVETRPHLVLTHGNKHVSYADTGHEQCKKHNHYEFQDTSSLKTRHKEVK